MPELNAVLAGGRFVLERKLGVGGMGSVYDALDQKRHVHVALKSLGQIDPLTVSSFKAEFRDFQHLHHPNLVVLDEFFSEGNEWHFTMELLAGEDFLAHVRRSSAERREVPTELAALADLDTPRRASRVRVYPGTLDIPVLRETLRQLAAGLAHLHSAGKVHRDVKSSNVIITTEGRTVLLDFGVSVDVKGKGVQLAGTPLYMAPELFWHSATPAADWYSVGVLLYQALTGMDPWQGGGIGGLITTKRPPPTHPTDLDPTVPEELGNLCLSLLEANPKNRAGRRAILDWVESTQDSTEPPTALEPEPDGDPEIFIGRGTELAMLRASFDEIVVSDEPIVVFLQGESGIGKSALVHNFTERLGASDRFTLLRGRVLEEEVVPYKSVDGIIDSMGEHFLELGYEKVKPLLPDHFNIVADVFPVLRRSPAVAELPRTAIPDPSERRVLMFGALKECLRRLANQTNLVVAVDDLQWSDADSLQLWNEIVRAPNAPRMLLVATLRTDRTGSIRPSRRPPSIAPNVVGGPMATLPRPTRTLWLARLSESESMAYVEARATSNSISPEEVVEAASGHPLFIEELLRYRGKSGHHGDLTLEFVLSERIGHLDPEQQRYLKLVCLSAKPLSRNMFSKAAGLSHGAGLRAFKALRASRLVRTGRTLGPDGDDWVDAFHYRVRNACLGPCDDAERAGLHRAIASTMEQEAHFDVEQLAIEWRGAGAEEKTAEYAERAADGAFAALAFQKAAEFYAEAHAIAKSEADRRRIGERLARSLRNAGNGKAAADVFLEIARTVSLEAGFAYKCEAVELLLRSGYVDEALTWARALLAAVGETMPASNSRSLVEIVTRRALIAARRRRWHPSPTGTYAPAELQRIDALWSVCFGLGSIAALPSFALCARYVQHALELGEPARVARAFAIECVVAANGKGGNVNALVEEARRAERAVPDVNVPVVWSSTALAMVLSGNWPVALQTAQEAVARITSECAGSVGEWAMAAEAELWALSATGRYAELYRAVQNMRTRAENTRDLYATLAASVGLPNLAWVARDEAERGIEVTRDIVARWSQEGLHLQHLFDAYAQAQAHLYLGSVAGARSCLSAFDARAKGKFFPVPVMMAVLRLDLEARLELASYWATRKGSLAVVEQKVKKLRALGAPWARALALLDEAGLFHARGELAEGARVARLAAEELDRVGMAAHRIAAVAYAASIEGSPTGGALDELRSLGVVRPERFVKMLVPGLG